MSPDWTLDLNTTSKQTEACTKSAEASYSVTAPITLLQPLTPYNPIKAHSPNLLGPVQLSALRTLSSHGK